MLKWYEWLWAIAGAIIGLFIVGIITPIFVMFIQWWIKVLGAF